MRSITVLYVALFLIINITTSISAQEESETNTFTGVITTFTDSGLGPYYTFDVENPDTKESISALLYIDFVLSLNKEFGGEDEVPGNKVTVEYTVGKEYIAESVTTVKTTQAQEANEDLLSIAGKFSFCEIGDMGGYLDIVTNNGEMMSFMTSFECPEDVSEGDDIVVYYTINEEINIVDVKTVK